jgi:hypothetical protein
VIYHLGMFSDDANKIPYVIRLYLELIAGVCIFERLRKAWSRITPK